MPCLLKNCEVLRRAGWQLAFWPARRDCLLPQLSDNGSSPVNSFEPVFTVYIISQNCIVQEEAQRNSLRSSFLRSSKDSRNSTRGEAAHGEGGGGLNWPVRAG